MGAEIVRWSLGPPSHQSSKASRLRDRGSQPQPPPGLIIFENGGYLGYGKKGAPPPPAHYFWNSILHRGKKRVLKLRQEKFSGRIDLELGFPFSPPKAVELGLTFGVRGVRLVADG